MNAGAAAAAGDDDLDDEEEEVVEEEEEESEAEREPPVEVQEELSVAAGEHCSTRLPTTPIITRLILLPLSILSHRLVPVPGDNATAAPVGLSSSSSPIFNKLETDLRLLSPTGDADK